MKLLRNIAFVLAATGLFAANAIAGPLTLSDSNVTWSLVANSGGTTSDSSGNFTLTADTVAGNDWYIHAFSLKDWNSDVFTLSNLTASDGSWTVQTGGVNATGCNTSPASAQCVFYNLSSLGLPIDGSTYTWTFDITLNSGTFGTEVGNFKHLVRDENGNKTGDLISAPLSWTFDGGEPPGEIPEPGTLALLGLGLLALGLTRRRRQY